MNLTFLGAARNVTGSRYLLETGDCRLLVDCGLHQERTLRRRDREPFPVPPSSINAVILTHGHLDHCGYLPRLAADGFRGPVLCTPPTAAIAAVVMADAAHLYEADTVHKARRHRAEHREPPRDGPPLYSHRHVEAVLPLFRTVPLDTPYALRPGISVTFHEAGHILGSSSVTCTVTENGTERICAFSGDLGGYGRPILRDPRPPRRAGVLVMESTYGDRLHDRGETCRERLRSVLAGAAVRQGKVIIPVFSVGRAQELLYNTALLARDNALPELPFYLDSPMAGRVTEIYRSFPGQYDRDARLLAGTGFDLFGFPGLHTAGPAGGPKALDGISGPAVIMAGAGMCTGGRVKHHLDAHIEDPAATVLFIGYQAEGTLGREIADGVPQVRIFGQMRQVRARVERIEGFSAHADRDGLLRWLGEFEEPPAGIFVTHGEEEAAMAFAGTLRERGYGGVAVPEYGDRVQL